MSSVRHSDLFYPFVPAAGPLPGLASRLADIDVIVYGDDEDIATPTAVTLTSLAGVVTLAIGSVDVLSTPAPVDNTPFFVEVNENGVRALFRWGAGDSAVDDTGPLQLEPCKVIWISPYTENQFRASLLSGNGLGFVEGDGISTTAEPNRVFSGSPEEVQETLSCMRTLNGLSTRLIPVNATRSVQMEVTVTDDVTTLYLSEKPA